MHRFILGLKSWLRGVHSSVRDLQKYLDEYCYRFNTNRTEGNIFNLLLIRMVNYPPRTSNKFLVLPKCAIRHFYIPSNLQTFKEQSNLWNLRILNTNT